MKNISIKTGTSENPDTIKAAEEVLKQIRQDDTKLIIFFAYSGYDQQKLNAFFKENLAGVPFLGCSNMGESPPQYPTSAFGGEITNKGFKGQSLTAMSIASGANKIEAVVKLVKGEGNQNWMMGAEKAIKEAALELNLDLNNIDPKKYCGLAVFDGTMCLTGSGPVEDIMERYSIIAPDLLFVGMGGINSFDFPGGASVIHTQEGAQRESLAIALLRCETPFIVEMASNFEPTEKVFRITKMEGAVIKELDGKPAADAYAEALGVQTEELGTPEKPNHALFLLHPMGFMIKDKAFLRSGLTMDKEKGLVIPFKAKPTEEIFLMRNVEIVEHTKKSLKEIKQKLGAEISGIIYFACASRLIEARRLGKEKELFKAMNIAPLVGLHMGPECYGGILVGHTLTMLVFGK